MARDSLPDFKQLFERGFAERNERERSEWHVEPSIDEYHGDEKTWHWHASAIGGCVRAQILKRAGMAPDPPTVDSEMAFAFGHVIHSAAEDFLNAHILEDITGGEWRAYNVEGGGAHPTLALKAKPDAILMNPLSELVGFDWKTESGASLKIRKDKAKASKSKDNVSIEHKLQVTTGAIVIEARDDLPPIKKGMVLYISKRGDRNVWEFFREEFTITAALRKAVMQRYHDLNEAWGRYEDFGTLPPRLDPEISFGKLGPNWRCRARDASDDRGKFCPSRSVCFNLPPVPEPAQVATIQPEPKHKIIHKSAAS